MLTDWTDDGTDFGTARGLDYIALDVYVTLAERFGATVHRGALPADIEADQDRCRDAAESHYGDRAGHLREQEPFAAFTVSHDGGTMSGEHADGNGHTSGYRGHYWRDRIGPETVVLDLRTIPADRIVRFAVSGPMLNVALAPGTMSTLRADVLDSAGLRDVAEAYLAPFGGIKATGIDAD